jgi:hypothetical protein
MERKIADCLVTPSAKGAIVSIFDTQKNQTTRRTFSILPQTTAPHHWKIFDDRDQPIGEVSRRRNGNLPVIKSASAG